MRFIMFENPPLYKFVVQGAFHKLNIGMLKQVRTKSEIR